MNNIHQVIFNRATQQFVVVSELAKSAGKPKAVSAGLVDIVAILQNFSEKRPLVDFSLTTRGQINNTANNTLTASTSNGVASVGVGSSKAGRTETHSEQSLQLTHLNALGNLTIVSQEGNLTANAAQLQSGGDMHLQGNQVSLNALTENEQTHLHQYHHSSGMGISAVYNPVKVFKDNFGQQAEQGSATGIIGKIFTAVDAVAKTGNQVTNLGGAYANTHRSSLDKNSYQERAVVTTADAGGDLSIVATTGSLTSQGGQLSAKGDGYLFAKEELLLDVATSTSGQNAQEKRKGAELNIAKVSVGAYADKNLGEGESQTEQATVLSFGGNATLTAQEGNLTLKGTQAVAEGTVNINAGKDILLTTATTRTAMGESQTGHAWGDVVVSETERFNGYNRKLDSQNNEQVSHQQALIASLNESVNINAGKDFHSTSGQILAKNRIELSAEKVTFNTAHNTVNNHHHSSDLKFGQFTRVISPIIDLIQSVEQAVNNKEASDRVRLAQALGTAAKAYSTAGDLANGGALFRVETGTGFSHSRERNETASRESVGNQVNAQHIDITSRSGDITATHTAFTSRDEQGKRLKDSSITFNSAKDLNLNAGQSEYRMKGRQQSSGFEAGTGVAVGAQTGWYVYAQAGFSNGKQDEYHLTHHNSQIDTETLNINTQGNTTLQGAVAKANRINADIKGNLTIESLQDIHQSESDSAGFGGRIQAAIGTAWGGSAYGNMASGSSNVKQVVEQSGLFAEAGGYNVTANNVELIGGAIASQNPENSTLTTNTITFTDIQNESSSQAVSAGISASANLNKQAGTEAKTEAEAKQQAKVAKLTGTSQSNGINPSVPMFDSSQDSSVTKATLTEGKITLNKDSTPTQTTAKELGINTDLSQANRQVEQPKDIKQVLKEQQILSQAAGDMLGAVSTYAKQRAKEAEEEVKQAKAALQAAEKSGNSAKIDEKQTAYNEARAKQESWEDGGENKRRMDAAVMAITSILSGGSAGQVAVTALSPELNAQIHELTKDSKTANLLAHATLSALEAKVAGTNAMAGAVAGLVGEGSAMLLAETVFNKPATELTNEERNLLKVAGQLAGAVSGNLTGGTTGDTVFGAETAKRAVDNNFLSQAEYAELNRLMKKKVLTPEEAFRVQYLLEKDKVSDRLLNAYQTNPDSLSQRDREVLFKWVREYGNVPMQLKLLETSISSSQMKPDYSDLKLRAQRVYNYSGSVEGRLSDSVATGLSVVGTGGNSVVIKGIQYVEKAAKVTSSTAQTAANTFGAFAAKYPKTTEGILVETVSTGYDLYNGEATPEGTMMNYILGLGLAGRSWDQQLSVNAIYKGVTAVNENKSNKEIATEQIANVASVGSGELIGSLVDMAGKDGIFKQIISNIASGYVENRIEKVSGEKLGNEGDKK